MNVNLTAGVFGPRVCRIGIWLVGAWGDIADSGQGIEANDQLHVSGASNCSSTTMPPRWDFGYISLA